MQPMYGATILSMMPDRHRWIEESEYARLSELFEKMHSKVQGEYHLCDAAKRQKEGNSMKIRIK